MNEPATEKNALGDYVAALVQPQLPMVTAGEIMMNVPLLAQIDVMAKRMATAKATIPEHLAGNEGDCWAIIMQAVQWRMNPYLVAQKTHIVKGHLGYEAQLVNAVVQSSGMCGRFHYEYQGEGAKMSCRVGSVLKGEADITWGEWLAIASVTTKNSPLWSTNPKQQIGYLQVKNWARAHCPGAILGVYTREELQDSQPMGGEREIGPQVSDINASLKSGESEQKVIEAEQVDTAEDEALTLDGVIGLIGKANTPALLKDAIAKATDLVGPDTTEDDKNRLNAAYKTRLDELQAIADADPANQ